MFDYYNTYNKYNKICIEMSLIQDTLKSKTFALNITNKKIKDNEEARAVFTTLSKEIQKNTKEHIETITTMSMQAVFDRPYTYHLIFEEKRNTMTCTPIIKLGDKEYVPKDDQGGAMLDIVGFIQKIILWSMESPRSRNTLILDEPFRFCGSFTIKAARIVAELSRKLKLQLIIITHSTELAEICDRTFKVENTKGVSKITRVK